MKNLNTMNPQADWTAIKTILSSQVFDSYTTGVNTIEQLVDTLKSLSAEINNTQDILMEYGCSQMTIFALNKLHEIVEFIAIEKVTELTDSQESHLSLLKQLPATITKKKPIKLETIVSFLTDAVNDFEQSKEITIYLCVLTDQFTKEIYGIKQTLNEHDLHDETMCRSLGDMADIATTTARECFDYFNSMVSYFHQFRNEVMAVGNGVTPSSQAKII